MEWYWIVAITVVGTHVFNLAVLHIYHLSKRNYDEAFGWMVGLAYYPIYPLAVIIRAIYKYIKRGKQ
jgi:hypothetical protein